ncbi:MAG: hypothetical protein K9G58_04560 [Bacteroidales bacterium]|nr:hypothetical protein [Bacteroidales bacterium]MCF8387104.1 hypothetical protein [Bacteroidales bacterium]MCF8397418.1 hypothetical protein [Bacteroidales bacterium]
MGRSLKSRFILAGLFLFSAFAGFSAKVSDSIPQASLDQIFVIDAIYLKGNKVTKDFIIYREMEFRAGDSLQGKIFNNSLRQTRENLLNTSLFNFVTMQIDTNDINHFVNVNVTIDMVERWYIWPFPIFEFADRNFNAWLKTKDFSKVNYGGYLVWDNFRGRKEKLTLLVRLGYDERYQLFYEKPYINKKQTLGLGFGFLYSQSHEIAVQTLNDTLNFLKLENNYPSRQYKAFTQVILRPDIHNTHTFQLGYEHFNFLDTVFKVNPRYSVGSKKKENYFSVYYKYKSDYRDFVAYPLHGYYFDLIFYKHGLGIIPDNEVDVLTLESTFRKYWQLSKRFYFASLLTAQFATDKPIPYHLRTGLGYGRYFVRGYEYYVIDGSNYGLSRSNLKFSLLPTKVFNINFIPVEQFSKIHFAMYLNAFWDMGYVEQRIPTHNELPNRLIYGYGLGLDLVTYYDVVLRMEVSTNKMNETGFFIHFMAPI